MVKFPPLVTGLIAICLLLALVSQLGSSCATMQPFILSDACRGAGLDNVLQGQVWRLLTPIFLHFSILHVVFNMMWLWQLGGALEARMGWREVLVVVCVFGAGSNLSQYFADPRIPFGGMSGVVYGLLGYFWAQGKFNPRFGMRLHKPIVIMMLVWFALCWSGFVGNIANVAHTAGLLLGLVWGYASARIGRP